MGRQVTLYMVPSCTTRDIEDTTQRRVDDEVKGPQSKEKVLDKVITRARCPIESATKSRALKEMP